MAERKIVMNDDVFEDHDILSLRDVCETCGIERDAVFAYVGEGLVEVSCEPDGSMRFTRSHVVRLQRAVRLERDLRLNPAGSVLALELMAEIEQLKNQLRFFKKQL